jgi:hypothetical protein
LPWASGSDPLQKPIAYTAQEGLADGFLLMVLARASAVMAGTRLLLRRPAGPSSCCRWASPWSPCDVDRR